MESFLTFTHLLGLADSNLPVFREARIQRYESVKKMMDLIEIAGKIAPKVPVRAFHLDPFDPQWDDMMPFPVIDRSKYVQFGLGISSILFFYAYNYNVFTNNIRFRLLRVGVPMVIAGLYTLAYTSYKRQVLKINLFDQYCWLRAQQLIKQNEYLFQHQDFKRYFWYKQDLKETLAKVYRQANNHHSSDFKDSELLLQDFISRYTDPNSISPMKDYATHL